MDNLLNAPFRDLLMYVLSPCSWHFREDKNAPLAPQLGKWPPGATGTLHSCEKRLFVAAAISLGAPERFVGHAWDIWDMWSSQADILAECLSVRREEKQEPVPRSYFKAVPLKSLIWIALEIGFHTSL